MSGKGYSRLLYICALTFGSVMLASCAVQSGPTLGEVRLGHGKSMAADTTLRSGEIRGEITQIDPVRREIIVRTDDGRRQVLPYDVNDTSVTYHGRDYKIENLESGDVIAFDYPYRRSYVDSIRIQEPVQARASSAVAGAALPPRANVVEGTVERVHPNLAAFDVKTNSGRVVTVSIPYNARTADVENFRRLRAGDYVRVEGQFVNSENLQLMAFISPR